jgi:hypothetical protein
MGAGIQRGMAVGAAVKEGKAHDAYPGQHVSQAGNGLQGGEARFFEVNQHHVGLQFGSLRQGLLDAAGGAHEDDPGLSPDKVSGDPEEIWVIVHQ